MRMLLRTSVVVAALFVTSVVPLSASADVADRLPGRPKSGEITLTRGLS